MGTFLALAMIAFVVYLVWKENKKVNEKRELENMPGKCIEEIKILAESDAEVQALADTGGLVNIGVGYCSKSEYKKALPFFAKAALQEHREAQYNLGEIFYYGRGVNQDYAKARYWYERAAYQGDADAQNNLGLLYLKGQGVKKDEGDAYKWFKKAAEQGNELAKQNLSLIPNYIKIIYDKAEGIY